MFRIFNTLILAVLITFPTLLLFAEMKPLPVDKVLSEIRQEQGVKNNDAINPEKVSPSKLEELGDSVMEIMIGNSDRHEQMDKMMGGEGSPNLTAMHQRIGFNYLSGYPLGMMNLISGGMMGYSFNNSNLSKGGRFMMNGYFPGMMGGFGWGSGGMFVGLIFLILIVAAIFIIVRVVSGGHLKDSGESAIEILRKRYAKGEITKEDFERIKKDI